MPPYTNSKICYTESNFRTSCPFYHPYRPFIKVEPPILENRKQLNWCLVFALKHLPVQVDRGSLAKDARIQIYSFAFSVQSGPPNPPSYFASAGGRSPRTRTESERSVVIMFNSSQTDLPPVLRIESEGTLAYFRLSKSIDQKSFLPQLTQIKLDLVIV